MRACVCARVPACELACLYAFKHVNNNVIFMYIISMYLHSLYICIHVYCVMCLCKYCVRIESHKLYTFVAGTAHQ